MQVSIKRNILKTTNKNRNDNNDNGPPKDTYKDELLNDPSKRRQINRKMKNLRDELPSGIIVKAMISVYSFKQMKKYKVCDVVNTEKSGYQSVNDPRMGVVGKMAPCSHCLKFDCSGHFGLITFNRPIYNPLFIRTLVSVLTCVCNSCGRLLLTQENMQALGFLRLANEKRLTALEDYCKVIVCTRHEHESNVIPCTANPIYLPAKVKDTNKIMYKKSSFKALEGVDDKEYVMPLGRVKEILKMVPEEDLQLMGFRNGMNPKNLIMKGILVNPVVSRPPTKEGGVVKHDLMTNLFIDIVEANIKLEKAIKEREKMDKSSNLSFWRGQKNIFITRGTNYIIVRDPNNSSYVALAREMDSKMGPQHLSDNDKEIARSMGFMLPEAINDIVWLKEYQERIFDQKLPVRASTPVITYTSEVENNADPDAITDELFNKVKKIIDNDDSKSSHYHNYISIMEKVQGKAGAFRAMIMGKRVDFSARTILGPAPNIKFGQIAVPRAIASVVTIPAVVFSANLDYLNKLLEAGQITHITKGSGPNKGLRKLVKPEYAHTYILEIGDKVDRWIQDGDYIIFNRQPTLHKQSMLGYEVVLTDRLTFGLHLSSCAGHNADFDGDEGNGWIPQSFEVMSEAQFIMNSRDNIMYASQNRPIVGFVLDMITGAFKMTGLTEPMNPEHYFNCITLITDGKQLLTLDERLALHRVPKYSGKALFSALLPEDFYYRKGDVLIVDGVLVSGRITKEHVGATGRSIIQELWTRYGRNRTVSFLTDGPFVIDHWLTEYVHTVGAEDCAILNPKHIQLKKEEIARTKILVEALGPVPSDPMEQSYHEQRIVGYVRKLDAMGARLGKEVLSKNNNLGVMVSEIGGGGKGGLFNVTSTVGSVGQQFYRGKRIEMKLAGGTKCHPGFDANDPDIGARGFCSNSYFEGLTPIETFWTCYGGREGITDTATKTSESGEIHRKMIKSMENVYIVADGSVRNQTGNIFQFIFGGHGFDTAELMKVNSNGYDNLTSFIDFKIMADTYNTEAGWMPLEEISRRFQEVIASLANGELVNQIFYMDADSYEIFDINVTQLAEYTQGLKDQGYLREISETKDMTFGAFKVNLSIITLQAEEDNPENAPLSLVLEHHYDGISFVIINHIDKL